MSHRAEQIIDALVALMPSTAKVYKHRVATLSNDEGELPARSINMGEDLPIDDDGASNFAFLDSLLTVNIEHFVEDSNEISALSRMLDMRRETHIAIMADRSLGLAFVIDTRYGGADAPDRDAEQNYVAGMLNTHWHVHYRMNIADPA